MLTDWVVWLVSDSLRRTANMTGSVNLLSDHQAWKSLLECHLGYQGVPWHLLAYLALSVILVVLYRIAFTPLDRVMDMTDVGWGCLGNDGGKKSIGERIREVQKLRKTGNLPPVYPNGWFVLIESRDVAVKQVVSVQAFGETMAVFRSADGEAHVTDAYCPHIGANMAVGGVVKGDCLECPFHGWLFRGSDGACVKIPYTNKAIPSNAKVKRWESCESNGFIFVWYDAEGRPPQWELTKIHEVNNGSWKYRGRTMHHVLAHIQEIPENGADVAHLAHLHVPIILKGSDLRHVFAKSLMDLAKHSWQGEWEVRAEPESHTADLTVTHELSILGDRFKVYNMTVKVEQIGPGVVYLYFNTSLGKGVLIQTVTPVEPLKQRVIHHFYSCNTFIAPYAKFCLLAEAKHFERDIMVWNNKQFLNNPLLVAEDKFIKRFRRWYSQFYSENSPKFKFQKDTLDW